MVRGSSNKAAVQLSSLQWLNTTFPTPSSQMLQEENETFSRFMDSHSIDPPPPPHPTVAICDNKYYSCAIFPLCVWENHTGCLCCSWPETRSGRPQWPPTENENRVSATFPELLSLQERKSGLGSLYFCPPWFLTAVWRGPKSLLPRVRYK